MKRKDQMKVILEIMEFMNNAEECGGTHGIEQYEVIMERCIHIISQYPRDDIFYQIISGFHTSCHIRLEDEIEKLPNI